MNKAIFNAAAALTLVAGLAAPGAVLASEVRVTAPYPQTSVIDFSQVLSQGDEIRITMPVPGQLAITVVRPGWQPSGFADDVLVLDAGRMGHELDDFGGPFGWGGISITSPSVTITSGTGNPAAAPDVAEQSSPEAGD